MINTESKVFKLFGDLLDFFSSASPYILIGLILYFGNKNVNRLEKEIQVLKKQNQTLQEVIKVNTK